MNTQRLMCKLSGIATQDRSRGRRKEKKDLLPVAERNQDMKKGHNKSKRKRTDEWMNGRS